MMKNILHTVKTKINLKKKGVSPLISYILLIVVGITMGLVIYGWLRTYVPAEITKCDQDVSLQVTRYTYDCTNKIFKLEIKNNGRFNVGGYLIRATNDSSQDVANVPLGRYYNKTSFTYIPSTSFLVSPSLSNDLEPEKDWSLENNLFNLTRTGIPAFQGNITKIQITPIRIITTSRGTKAPAICSDATITERISCS